MGYGENRAEAALIAGFVLPAIALDTFRNSLGVRLRLGWTSFADILEGVVTLVGVILLVGFTGIALGIVLLLAVVGNSFQAPTWIFYRQMRFVRQRTIEAVITQTADAISGARPGARRETLETYVKRLERLEQIAMEFSGVDKVYAMQAGREVRVMVKPEEIDDLQAEVVARDIAKKVEEELQYPGQIRITVIRELRASSFAK
mgnify:CR=1 FL=1